MAEVITQATLLALVLIGIFGYDRHELGRGLLGIAVLILCMFCLTGYVLTTAISRAIWKWGKPWVFSVAATALFLIHFEILSIGVGGAFAPHDRLLIRIAGACIAFLTTVLGTGILKKWLALPDRTSAN